MLKPGALSPPSCGISFSKTGTLSVSCTASLSILLMTVSWFGFMFLSLGVLSLRGWSEKGLLLTTYGLLYILHRQDWLPGQAVVWPSEVLLMLYCNESHEISQSFVARCTWRVRAQSFWFFATHGLYPARLPCPWNFLGKNTGVGYHFLLQGNLSNPGIEPASLVSPALAGRFFTTWATWEAPLPLYNCAIVDNKIYGDFPGSPVVRTLRFQ